MLARAPTAATGRLQSSSVSRCARPAAGRAALRVRAEAGPGGAPQGGSSGTQSSRASSAAAKPSFSSAVDRMATRYDWLSTGCGALAVTGYCVMRGQDAATAATITVVATVVALVANELMFEGRD